MFAFVLPALVATLVGSSSSAAAAAAPRLLSGKPNEPRLQRINITSPYQMLNITECEQCTGRRVNQDSIFCRQGKATVEVFNATDPSISLGVRTAEAYCWDGTFGAILSVKGTKQWAYEEPVVTWDVQCELGFILYNQCILSALVAIILMVFGSIAFLGITTALCICLGCCNCCFVKRKFATSDDDKICCLFSSCDSGTQQEREMLDNPMAARERERKELESDGGLI